MPVASAIEPAPPSPLPFWRRILSHPLMALAVFVLLTQWLDERCYPFSNFPMYANPGERASYIYLSDETGKVLGMTFHTGLSSAKLNKIFNNKLKELGVRSTNARLDATDGRDADAGSYVIETARRLAEKRRRPLPERVRLIRVIIEREGRSLKESSQIVAEG